MENKFETIIHEAIGKADDVDASFEDYAQGLRAMLDILHERVTLAEEEVDG